MPNHAKTRLLCHHMCLLFDKAQLRQVTVALLVLPLCLPILYAPLTKATTFRNATLAPSGAFRPDNVIGYLNAPIPRPASPVASASGERLPPSPGLGGSEPFPATASSSDVGVTINLELLEEEPPAAGESWGRMAQGLPSLLERRSTFGLVVGLSSVSVLFLG
jgi:hypothetical protein